jgi:hypothetical protein
MCASKSDKIKFSIHEKNGTAQILSSENGTLIKQVSLDEIIESSPEFNNANILKIDTDGYDFQILIGAESFIKANKPAVLFECDAFSNKNYIEDFFDCISMFIRSGYTSFILYDNLGNMMGKYNIKSEDFYAFFSSLISWQKATRIIYFDILFLPTDKIDGFLQKYYT